jgi:hypothetical protein
LIPRGPPAAQALLVVAQAGEVVMTFKVVNIIAKRSPGS